MKLSSSQGRWTKRLVAFSTLATLCVGSVASAQQVTIANRGGSDYHTVERGDTLYDLSGRYLADVFEWPRLWSFNPHITNPHWIYPGDIVYLKPEQPGAKDKATGPRKVTTQYSQTTTVHMATGGFIVPEQEEYVGRIVASPKQAGMLAEHDVVWVGFGDDAYTDAEKEETEPEERTPIKNPEDEVRIGSTFAIVRQVGTVNAPDDEETVLGHKYIVLGSVRVTERSDKYLHTAEIAQSWYEIQRGDLLIPYEQQLKQVSIIRSEQDLVASISGTVEPRTSLGEYHYVYIDKGSKSDLKVGNRFYAFQRFEGLQFRQEKTDAKIPWQRIGQVLLIDVQEDYSTGLVIDSSREIVVGDRLEMYKGY